MRGFEDILADIVQEKSAEQRKLLAKELKNAWGESIMRVKDEILSVARAESATVGGVEYVPLETLEGAALTAGED